MANDPITFLHGFLGAPRDWDDVRANLCEAPTAALEIPPARSWTDGVGQIASAIPSGSILVGYSMGARIALAVAMEGHVKLGGLVLVSGQTGLRPAERPARWKHDLQVAERMEREVPETFLTWWYRQSVFAGDSAELKQRLVAEKSGLDLRSEAARLRTYSVARQPDYAPCLSQLRIPVMFIAGRGDEKYATLAANLASTSAVFGYQIVEGCGHIVHRQQPKTVAQILQRLGNTSCE